MGEFGKKDCLCLIKFGGCGLMNFFPLQEEVENLSIEERRLDEQIR